MAGRRYPFLKFAPGIDWQHVDPQILAGLNRLGAAKHVIVTITSGYRTYAKQAALYDAYLHGGNVAARPGYSMHEHGAAVDATVNGTPIVNAFGSRTDAIRLLQKYGLDTIYKNGKPFDFVHVQLAGTTQTSGGGSAPAPASQPAAQTPAPEPTVTAPAGSGQSQSLDLTVAQSAPPAGGPPSPYGTVPSPAAPGSEGMGITDAVQAWRQIAQMPMASPDSQSFAQQLAQATGGP